MRTSLRTSFPLLGFIVFATAGSASFAACTSGAPPSPTSPIIDNPHPGRPVDAGVSPGVDATPPTIDASSFATSFCALPGSYVNTGSGMMVVPGGPNVDLSWLTVPQGFCAHYYGNVPEARQIRVSPAGEVVVASPATPTAGGANGGSGSVIFIPDDNADGTGDQNLHFIDGVPSVEGLMFSTGFFYYQDDTRIRRVVYTKGDRTATSAGDVIVDINAPQASIHWPKTMDMADDGTIYVGNGGDQGDSCDTAHTFRGGILSADGTANGKQIAKGFRNPIAIRCEHGHNVCFVAELALDGSGGQGGREKLVPIRQGDDWGFPCCATTNTPYAGVTGADCSHVATDENSFTVGHTPFGLDFELSKWPAPWTNRMFVVLHGDVGTWFGARVVAIAIDPSTGMPLPSNEMGSGTPSSMSDFATGWDTGRNDHGRPAAITFGADGRMFVANDINGDVIWFAPIDLGATPPQDAGVDATLINDSGTD